MKFSSSEAETPGQLQDQPVQDRLYSRLSHTLTLLPAFRCRMHLNFISPSCLARFSCIVQCLTGPTSHQMDRHSHQDTPQSHGFGARGFPNPDLNKDDVWMAPRMLQTSNGHTGTTDDPGKCAGIKHIWQCEQESRSHPCPQLRPSEHREYHWGPDIRCLIRSRQNVDQPN